MKLQNVLAIRGIFILCSLIRCGKAYSLQTVLQRKVFSRTVLNSHVSAHNSNENFLERNAANIYSKHWEDLLQIEHNEKVDEIKLRRKKWSKSKLESTGMSIFDAAVEPDSEVYGEKIVRVYRKMRNMSYNRRGKKSSSNAPGSEDGGYMGTSWRDTFTKGDVLIMTPTPTYTYDSFSGNRKNYRGAGGGNEEAILPRECLVIDVGSDWLTLGVGRSWPFGLWERRKDPGAFVVRLDRSAPHAPLKAQRFAELINK